MYKVLEDLIEIYEVLSEMTLELGPSRHTFTLVQRKHKNKVN
jgi:hypothetical protein